MFAKAEQQQLIAQMQSFLFMLRRQTDRHVPAKAGLAHRFGETSVLQSLIFEKTPGRHDLWTKDRVGPGIEFSGFRRFRAKHRKSFGIAVVEDLDNLGAFIRETEVAFVDD